MSFSKITPEQVAPELRKYIINVPDWVLLNPIARSFVGLLRYFIIKRHTSEGISIEDTKTSEGLMLHIYKPHKQSGAAMVWIHGGGMVMGNPKDNDTIIGETARQLGIIIVSPYYRLAPKHRFPAHLDDCLATWNWLLANAESLSINVNRLAVGGQSAGGGLAASLAQKIHDLGGIQPIAQWLHCPMLDDRTAANQDLDSIEHFVWNNRRNRFGWSAYLGVEAGTENVPDYAVPARRENLAGLPSTWIGIGGIDLFYEEDKIYADRLEAAGVPVTFDEVADAYHGFEVLAISTPTAQAYLQRSQDWLKNILQITHH